MVFSSEITSSFSESVDIYNIGNYYNRFNIYNKSINKLTKINKFKCLVPLQDNKFSVDNTNIILKKRIGSNSRYGIVYLSNINNNKFVTKLTQINKYNLNEIIIAKKLSDITINDINPHFLIIYKFFICNNNLEVINLPKLIKNNDYYMSINELVSGNFKNFLNSAYINSDLLLNALQQILISILAFHHFTNGLFHNDCHYKNFLFHRIKPGGYFHYKIYGKDVYIKNLGYLWIIWDFGLARKESEYTKRRLEDYFRITSFFLKYNNNLYFNDKDADLIKIVNNILEFKQTFYRLFNNSDQLFMEELFKIPKLFSFKIPIKSKIVNKSPYIIT